MENNDRIEIGPLQFGVFGGMIGILVGVLIVIVLPSSPGAIGITLIVGALLISGIGLGVLGYQILVRRDSSVQRLIDAGDVEGAELEIRRRIEAKSDSARLHNTHGTLLIQLGRFEEAAEAFELAASDERIRLVADSNRGLALWRSGNHAEGESLLRETADDPVHDVTSSSNLATLLAEAGRLDEAREWLAKAESAFARRDRLLQRIHQHVMDHARAAVAKAEGAS